MKLQWRPNPDGGSNPDLPQIQFKKDLLVNLKRIGLCFCLLITPLLIGRGVYMAQSNTNEDQPDHHWVDLNQKIKAQVQHFNGTAGIFIKDLKRGWVIEYNAETLFPSASLIKVPLMVALYDGQANGRISLEEVLALQRKFKAAGSGNLKFKRPGTRLTVRELIYRMITESDNTATNMLTSLLGLDYYNSYFSKLGLNSTNFSREIMDLRKRNRGVENYTTPKDMAKLLEMMYERKLTGSEEMLEILKSQKINDRLPTGIPPDWQIGHKTGLMRNTCHDVGIVFSPNSDYLICALTSDIRNYKRAKNFISEISHLTAVYYGNPALHQPAKKSFWSKFLSETRSGQG